MLCIRGYRLMKAPTGKVRIQQYAIFHKWTNEEAEELPFDILNPLEWKKFLRNFRLPSNKRLPVKSMDGEPIRYQIYYWGSPKWIKQHFSEKLGLEPIQLSYVVLFPGYDKNGKSLDVKEFGKI